MTILEIILISILWIGYGILATYQTKDGQDTLLGDAFESWNIATLWFILFIVFSPLVLIGKAIYGVFKPYEAN